MDESIVLFSRVYFFCLIECFTWWLPLVKEHVRLGFHMLRCMLGFLLCGFCCLAFGVVHVWFWVNVCHVWMLDVC